MISSIVRSCGNPAPNPAGARGFHTTPYGWLPRVSFEIKNPRSYACVQAVADVATAVWLPAAAIAIPSTLSKVAMPRVISPDCVNTLYRAQKTVHGLARKAGVQCPDLKVQVIASRGDLHYLHSFGSASHQPVINMAPQWLLLPKDIPQRLSPATLGEGYYPDAENKWIESFYQWLTEKFIIDTPPQSQLEADIHKEHLKIWFRAFRDENLYKALSDFLIGRELGHIYHGDHFKRSFVKLCLQIFLFPITPFSTQATKILTRHFEKRADLFSVNKLGERDAAIWLFCELRKVGEKLAKKYPELNEVPKLPLLNNLNRKDPTLEERIQYLSDLLPLQNDKWRFPSGFVEGLKS